MTHRRHVEDFFDEDNFLCKNCKEHSVAESMEISTESDNNEIGQDDNEDVFDTVEVIAEYESETNMHEGEELDITDILDIEVPVVAIEPNSISLTLGDESFSLPKSQKVRMTVARQMAINDSPDKLERNYPGDNPMEVNENFSQQFQSDVNGEQLKRSNQSVQILT